MLDARTYATLGSAYWDPKVTRRILDVSVCPGDKVQYLAFQCHITCEIIRQKLSSSLTRVFTRVLNVGVVVPGYCVRQLRLM
jgi:hypothetical protein